MVFKSISCSVLLWLNSYPIGLNLLHNHLVVPKRKSQFLVVSLAPDICLKFVTLQTPHVRMTPNSHDLLGDLQ